MLLALLLVIFSLRIADTYTVFNETIDEHLHVAAGLQYLEQRQYTFEAQHPPLARAVVAALPYFFAGLRLPEGYVFWDALWGDSPIEDYWLTLSLARMGNLAFGLLLAWFVYRWGSDLYGSNLGLIACFLVTFSPNVIAHTGLATVDIGATATTVAAAYYYYRWAVEPRPRAFILSAVWTGLAWLTKMSAVVFLPPIFVMLFLLVRGPRNVFTSLRIEVFRRAVARAAVFVTIVGGVIWAGYLFQVGTIAGAVPSKCEAGAPISLALREVFSPYVGLSSSRSLQAISRRSAKVATHLARERGATRCGTRGIGRSGSGVSG